MSAEKVLVTAKSRMRRRLQYQVTEDFWCISQTSNFVDGKWITVELYWWNSRTAETRNYVEGVQPKDCPLIEI